MSSKLLTTQAELYVIPGVQQQLALDPFTDTASETVVMPAGAQKEMINFKHANRGLFIPSTSQKPSTTNYFAPAIDPTITPQVMEKKANTDYQKEP
ncbi:odontogenic ameloblast-associated protein [Prionailurus iriomotensis]